MATQQEFRELLALFNAHDVEYVIIGAHALAFHGAPRYTGDLDILVRPHAANADRILCALGDFGFGSLELTAGDFAAPDRVIQLGVAPVRIDLVTSITGVSWPAVAAGKQKGTYADVPVHYIGRDQLIVNKRATGRAKDLADVEALGGT